MRWWLTGIVKPRFGGWWRARSSRHDGWKCFLQKVSTWYWNYLLPKVFIESDMMTGSGIYFSAGWRKCHEDVMMKQWSISSLEAPSWQYDTRTKVPYNHSILDRLQNTKNIFLPLVLYFVFHTCCWSENTTENYFWFIPFSDHSIHKSQISWIPIWDIVNHQLEIDFMIKSKVIPVKGKIKRVVGDE